jgi:hypothetical protein
MTQNQFSEKLRMLIMSCSLVVNLNLGGCNNSFCFKIDTGLINVNVCLPTFERGGVGVIWLVKPTREGSEDCKQDQS